MDGDPNVLGQYLRARRSAAVNAVQQIDGSLGPALFNTIAGSAVAGYLATNAAPAPARTAGESTVLEQATVHGCSVVAHVRA